MTATSASVRFGADGAAKVQSYVRLTASTYIRCCTYDDAAPILTIQDGPADITITNPGQGEVTEDDVAVRPPAGRGREPVRGRAGEARRQGPRDGGRPGLSPGRRRDGTADGGGAAGAGTSGRPWVLSRVHERGDQRMRKVVTGEQVAQLYNPDPFALPRLAGPGLPDPGRASSWWPARPAAGLAGPADRPASAGRQRARRWPRSTWLKLGWVTLVALVLAAVVVLVAWRWFWPVSFSRWVGRPARGKWRAWCYRRRWAAVMTIAGVAPVVSGPDPAARARQGHRHPVHRPGAGPAGLRAVRGRLRRVMRTTWRTGSAPCCAGSAPPGPGAVVLEFVRRDALAALVPALPIPDRPGSQGAAGRPAARTGCPGWSGCTARTS